MSVRVCMFQQRRILLPNDKSVENMSCVEWLEKVRKELRGYELAVRAGHTIVGFVTELRVEDDKVVGVFKESKSEA